MNNGGPEPIRLGTAFFTIKTAHAPFSFIWQLATGYWQLRAMRALMPDAFYCASVLLASRMAFAVLWAQRSMPRGERWMVSSQTLA